jgi:hypothetical protein
MLSSFGLGNTTNETCLAATIFYHILISFGNLTLFLATVSSDLLKLQFFKPASDNLQMMQILQNSQYLSLAYLRAVGIELSWTRPCQFGFDALRFDECFYEKILVFSAWDEDLK